MNQRVTIVCLEGEAGRHVRRLLERWTKARREDDDADEGGWSGGWWPADMRRAIDHFTATIATRREEPQVQFSAQAIDDWSMFDAFHQPFWELGQPYLRAMGNCSETLGWALPDEGKLEPVIDRLLRRKHVRGDLTRRWYLTTLSCAIAAGRTDGEVVVVAREMLHSRSAEKHSSTVHEELPSWVAGCRLLCRNATDSNRTRRPRTSMNT